MYRIMGERPMTIRYLDPPLHEFLPTKDEDIKELAATQVNIHKRLVVVDTSENRDQPMVFINPELLEKRGETGIEEGCLSVPECRAFVPRAEWIKVRALDRHGEPFEIEADGLLAICLQHEMDHLVGKLFVDYLSPLKRQRIRQKLEKLARNER
jgi:peptide deformylase